MAGRRERAEAHPLCARCGARVVTPAAHPRIEKPFAQCGECGTFVARAGAQEWDLLPASTRLGWLARIGAWALLGALLAALALLGSARARGARPSPREAALWLALGAAGAGALSASRLARAIRRSRRRLADPMYRAKLIEFELAAERARQARA